MTLGFQTVTARPADSRETLKQVRHPAVTARGDAFADQALRFLAE